MSSSRAVGLSLFTWVAACGPSLASGGGDETSSSTGDVADTGDTADDGSMDDGTDYCPCEMIKPDRELCTAAPSLVVEAEKTASVIAPIDYVSTRKIVVFGDRIVVQHGLNEVSLQQWSEGQDLFEDMLSFPPGTTLAELVAADDELFVLTRSPDLDLLSRWTEIDGLQTVAEFGDLRLDSSGARKDGRLAIGFGRALVAFPVHEHFPDAANITRAIADVNLATGSFELLAEPLAGWSVSADGWLGLRPELDMYQYCYDTGCFRPNVPVTWSLVQSSAGAASVLSAEHCVDGELPKDPWITHAWPHESGYVFSSTVALRSISAAGDADLWRGGGEIRDALLHDDAVFISTYLDSTNAIIRVPLDGSAPARWLSAASDHAMMNVHFAGVIDGRLYFTQPGFNRTLQLAAFDL